MLAVTVALSALTDFSFGDLFLSFVTFTSFSDFSVIHKAVDSSSSCSSMSIEIDGNIDGGILSILGRVLGAALFVLVVRSEDNPALRVDSRMACMRSLNGRALALGRIMRSLDGRSAELGRILPPPSQPEALLVLM